jgi:TolB protein
MYTRDNRAYVRDLRTANETLLTDGGTQWDWTRDGARAVFVKNGEIWTIKRDSNGIQKLSAGNAPQWNADGTLIVFERNLQWDSNQRFKLKGEVWTMNADGTGARKLNDGYDPTWSPDSGNRARIAFASNPTGSGSDWSAYRQNAIRLMNSQGQNTWTPLATNSSSPKFTPMEWTMAQARLLDSPQWSPDGRELTARVMDGHGTYVTTDSFNGGFGKFIAFYFDDMARGFSYSPDGNTIALGSGGLSGWETVSIYRRNAIGRDGVSGTALRTLGRIPRQATDVGQTITSYTWSPDGKNIAYTYVTYPSNDQSKPAVNSGIWVMDVTTGATRHITTEGMGPLVWLP